MRTFKDQERDADIVARSKQSESSSPSHNNIVQEMEEELEVVKERKLSSLIAKGKFEVLSKYTPKLKQIGEGSESYWKKLAKAAEAFIEADLTRKYDREHITPSEVSDKYEKWQQLKSSIGEETEGQDVWISVEDRLPDAACYCLIYQKDEQVRVSYYTKKRGFEENSLLENELWDINSWVTHWQPLPKPPINTLIKK